MTDKRTKRVTVEVVARMDLPQDTPMNRLLLHKTLILPLRVAPTSPAESGHDVQADFLTFQWRITDGDHHLPPLPYNRELHPVTDTRSRVVMDVLNDYRVGRGVPGDLAQTEALVGRILAALDVHAERQPVVRDVGDSHYDVLVRDEKIGSVWYQATHRHWIAYTSVGIRVDSRDHATREEAVDSVVHTHKRHG